MVPHVFCRNVKLHYCDRVVSLCDGNSFTSNSIPIRLGFVNDNHYVSILSSDKVTTNSEKSSESQSHPKKPAMRKQVPSKTQNDRCKKQIKEHTPSHCKSTNMQNYVPTRSSTTDKYTWITSGADGYYCKLCIDSQFASGPWVTVPVSKDNSKKLYTKAQKHAKSTFHKMALEKSLNTHTVAQQQCVAASRQSTEQVSVLKQMFRGAYFLFHSELPHTTMWRGLMSTVSALDGSGRIRSHLRSAPANAHHLSTTAITEILESFGKAMFKQTLDELQCISDVGEFAILADECTDINGREMLSICIRYIRHETIVERFLCVIPVLSTTADSIHAELITQIKKHNLDPSKIAAASFDGASNFSGSKGGVQALLKKSAETMIYVHCRSHVLQLCLVKACAAVPGIKRVVSSISKLYALFHCSPQRLHVLSEIQKEIDDCTHKLVQPGDTRWLSHEASVDVICKHFGSLCIALEHIYQDAGILASDAGGLLLDLRKHSTCFVLAMLSGVLKPLARLSKSLQSGTGDIVSAMEHAKTVMTTLSDMVESKFVDVEDRCNEMMRSAQSAGVRMELDSVASVMATSQKYVKLILGNMRTRFNDDVGKVAELHTILQTKPIDADFSHVSTIFKISKEDIDFEWKMLRRLECDLSTAANLIMLSTKPEKRVLFPAFSMLARRILLMPIGTAGVERSFSTMNRILRSERCRLSPTHVNTLMQLSAEGPAIPDVRDATEADETALQSIIDIAIVEWNKVPRRGSDC